MKLAIRNMKTKRTDRKAKAHSAFWGYLLLMALTGVAGALTRTLFAQNFTQTYNYPECYVLQGTKCVALGTECHVGGDGPPGSVSASMSQSKCFPGAPGNRPCITTNHFLCGYACTYTDYLQHVIVTWQTNSVDAYQLGNTNCMNLGPILTRVEHLACVPYSPNAG